MPGVGGSAFSKGILESGFYVKFVDFYILTNNFNLNATRAKLWDQTTFVLGTKADVSRPLLWTSGPLSISI